jgi:GTP-binding protein
LVEQEGRAIVIAGQQMGSQGQDSRSDRQVARAGEEKLTQLKGVPLVAVSGLTGEGLDG